jgi:uncharacterized membrane protein
LLIGIIFFPLTKKVFGKFSFDFGFPFSKALGLLVVSYVSYVLATLKVVPFNRMALFAILGISVIVNYLILRKEKDIDSLRKLKWVVIFEEALFLASLLFWAYVRSQEPSIKSLEKFMDFGFINSILRSDFFPPKDIWYTPEPINYYYFGHLTGAVMMRITNVLPTIGYNLILATIFAQGVTQVFSLVSNMVLLYYPKVKRVTVGIFGIITAYIVNLGANLHTIYVFTKGYPNDNPVPFWEIFSKYSPQTYWYPNATRFIPFTIHEFPSYSYVVADLHGHVFDIPFVLLTLALMFSLFTNKWTWKGTAAIGFMTAIHYMTNAFDGPIYILLAMVVMFYLFRISTKLFINLAVLIGSFILFSLPFSMNFSPFVSGIGMNCAPNYLVELSKIGPFLFENGNCQPSAFWMLFVLWGFFWVSFALFLINHFFIKKWDKKTVSYDIFFMILFAFGIFLTLIPEFFYIKDIYPQHFRANTMFKLGYQAFMMMGIASGITFFRLKQTANIKSKIMTGVFVFFAFFVMIYPFFSIPSYYGDLDREPILDGAYWLSKERLEDYEIINYLNRIDGQPVVLEAQGDSYTEYERISAFTGLPTVAGWWVHEWLWRGSPDFIGKRIPDVEKLYTSNDLNETYELIKKYDIKYVVVSRLERQKYPNLNEKKFEKIGKIIYRSTDRFGALYQVN